MFLNREEIPVHPLYRDPVHDFGFFRFDPGAVQFMKCEEIPLAPEAAAVGLEIRVVGNDSGEKVSILAGTLARLDRDAPHYKKDGYNDFNTFYMQVVRALKFLQRTKDECSSEWQAVHIPRGTLQMTLIHKGFDETRRLGLQRETEQTVRQASPPGETGMLVVDSVVPGGPAHKHLEPGDVLVRVNGEVVTQFLILETLLDDYVGKLIDLELERGGVPVKVTLQVEDLHSITPNYFLEVSGGVIQPLSYQQARNFRFNCGLVYVAEPGYMLSRAGVPRHAIIKKLAGEEITRIEDLISVLSKLSRGTRVPLEFVSHVDRHRSKSVLVTVDRHEWYAPPQLYTRDDGTGLWERRPALLSAAALPMPPVVHYEEKEPALQPQVSAGGETGVVEGESKIIDRDLTDVGSNMSSDANLSDSQNFLASPASPCRSETKRRRVHQQVAGEGIVASDCTLERIEEGLDDNRIVENTPAIDEGGGAGAINASVAEQVIEPTLVMFEALAKKDPVRRQVLRVKGCLAGSQAERTLEQGDMLLAIDGDPITNFRDVENACQRFDECNDPEGSLRMTVFRQGLELELLVGTDVRDGFGTTHMVNWCGSVVQDPHPAVRALGFLPEEGHGVYVARWCHGSPVHRYGLYALQWIVEVNGKPTPDLQTFVNVTKVWFLL